MGETSMKTTLKVTFVLLIVLAVAMGSLSLAKKPPKPEPCPFWDLVCLDVWDPVVCDDGVVYSNACYAKRVCAKGCEPYPGGPVPL